MPTLHTEPSRRTLLALAIIFALLANAALILGFEHLVETATAWMDRAPSDSMFRVEIVDDAEAEELPKKDLVDGQIVQNDVLEREEEPEDAKRLSEFDNRVERETRAPTGRPTPQVGQRRAQRSKAQQATEASQAAADGAGRESEATKKNQPLSDLLKTHELGRLESGQRRPSTDGSRESQSGTKSTNPSAVGQRSSLLASADDLAQMFGRGGTLQDLRDVDEGDVNSLNTKRNRYASFFNRVRDAIAQHWHPDVLHSAHDPYGNVYGSKDRVTKVMIQLRPDGSVVRVRTEGVSGVDYLDEEAVRSIWAAQPFSNPPADLVDPHTGYIEFRFMFTLEIGGRARIFRSQR